jgi:predicted RNase H-like nuclease (RuvC/YqgF family)
LKLNDINTKENKMIHNFYPIQSEIERIQNENNELLFHIKEMERVFQKQKKEIENIKNKNIYQKEIKSHINDVNNLTSL